MTKKLILAPHIDDDVLGCGGIMDKNTHVVYCGMDEQHLPERPAAAVRLQEAAAAAEYAGHQYSILNNQVNYYKVQSLIQAFESSILQLKPDHIYLPQPSYNQDHRVVYEAAITALRPHDKNFFVKKAFVYEQPHTFLWAQRPGRIDVFEPNYFVPIDIDHKVKLYNLMGSQVRSFRSPEILRSMAHLRGHQCNSAYAEAYGILRWVE